jgi:hypothetical protein
MLSSFISYYKFLILYVHRRQLALAVQKQSLKSDTKKASFQEKRNVLARQISKWRQAQQIYMPGTMTFPDNRTDENDVNGLETSEDIPLILPSELETTRRNIVCLHKVAEYEQQLHLAQIQDSLIELRRVRRIRYTLLLNHHMQVAGQGQRANTRSRALIHSIDERITKFAQRYCAGRHALVQLDPTGAWQETFLELKKEDNRGPGKEDYESGLGDGSYQLSWIWLSNPRARDTSGSEVCGEDGASQEDVNDVMRVQWTTSYARLQRWKEEVDLLQEEMRRVVTFLQWKSEDWLAKQDVRQVTAPPSIQSGLQGYARKQAAIHHNIAVSFSKLWLPVLISNGLERSWVAKYMKEHGIPLPNAKGPVSRAQATAALDQTNGTTSQAGITQDTQTQHSSDTATYDDASMLEEIVYNEDDYSDNNGTETDSLNAWDPFLPDLNDYDSDGEWSGFELD